MSQKNDYDNSNTNSNFMAAMLGALAGIALMAFTDRNKRRSILSTAQDLKNKANDTANEIKDDVSNMHYSAEDALKGEKDKITKDLQDTGFMEKEKKQDKK